MKSLLPTVLVAITLSSCTTGPPRPKHVDPAEYMSARTGSEYLGESQQHAFRKQPDGAIIFTDTEDLPAAEQAKVRSAGKSYSGEGANVRWH